MRRDIPNIFWKKDPTNSQIYGPIYISIILRENKVQFAGHCWRAKKELASGLVLWTPSQGARLVGRSSIPYIDNLHYDRECHPNDLSILVQDPDLWCDRLMHIRARSIE